MVETRKLITAALFGVLIAVIKGPLPPVYSDLLIIVEAPIIALSFIILGRGGATYTELINGLLQTTFQLSLGAFTLLIALLFGAQVDVYSTVLHVRSGTTIKTRRLMASLTLASTSTGLIAAYTSILLFPALIPYTPSLFLDVYLPIIVWGIISGALGGYIASRLWEKNLRARFQSESPGMALTKSP